MRSINRLLAALLSLALVAVGALVIIEVVAYRVNQKPAVVPWRRAYSWGGRTPWNQGSLRVACILLVVAGLILLAAELKRARVSRLTTEAADTDAVAIDTAYTRKGIAAAVRSAVTRVDGVRAAAITVSRRKVTVAASASARDKATAENLTRPITEAAERRLATLQLRSTPSVKVRVTPRRR